MWVYRFEIYYWNPFTPVLLDFSFFLRIWFVSLSLSGEIICWSLMSRVCVPIVATNRCWCIARFSWEWQNERTNERTKKKNQDDTMIFFFFVVIHLLVLQAIGWRVNELNCKGEKRDSYSSIIWCRLKRIIIHEWLLHPSSYSFSSFRYSCHFNWIRD